MERMPTDSTDAALLRSGPEVIPHNLVGPPRLARKRTHEDPTGLQQFPPWPPPPLRPKRAAYGVYST